MESKTVYSTEHGRLCAKCGLPITQCECGRTNAFPKGNGIIRVGRQTKGRKGKGVTLITGLPLDEEELQRLAKELKRKCSSGGTVKNGVIEIQGDHRAMLVDELKGLGYSARLSGG
jgi:translation initiation factor 1